jgi:flagellar FliJ protein
MESVLEWRNEKEKSTADRLNIKKTQVDSKNIEIEKLTEEYEKAKEASKNFNNTADLMRIQSYKQNLADSIEREMGHLSRLNHELEQIRDELIKAKQDKTALEKLKEKDYDRHKEKLRRFEQSFLDEVATLRYTRKEG